VSIWDIAQIFEAHAGVDLQAHDGVVHDYERGLHALVESTLREYTLADFSDGVPVSFKGIEDSANRYKFKPLVPAWVPKAPNSVFQLHLHS
jgi:hypothetical protein